MFRCFMKSRHILAAAAILAAGTLLAGPLCRAAGDDVRPVPLSIMFICPMFSILCQRQQPSNRPSAVPSRMIAIVRRFDAPMHSLELDSGPAVSSPRG